MGHRHIISAHINQRTRRVASLIAKPVFKFIFFLPIALSFLTIGIILLNLSKLPPEIPLYYSKPWGEEQLAHPLSLFILPVGTLIWFIMTLFLISSQTYLYRIFSQLLLVFSAIVSIWATYATIMIIMVVL